MNQIDFIKLVNEAHERNIELMRVKGDAYSGSDDVFANFKRNAERLGLSKYQVWLVYFMKHVDAIANAVKSAPNNPVDKSEGLTGRIDDAENYLKLLRGMLTESPPDTPSTSDITQDAFGRYRPYPVDSNNRELVIPKGVQFRNPNADRWYDVLTDTKLRGFVIGTDFRVQI